MRRFRLAIVAAALLGAFTVASRAQQEDPVPSSCIAMAQSLPNVVYANFTPQIAQADVAKGEVTITYVGHSTYLIDTPGGVRVATDYSGRYPVDPMPRVVTMNKAHSGHFTRTPDPSIEYPLNGWAEGGEPARHRVVVGDLYVRNVPTDIRTWEGGMEIDGNSIFIFEAAGLCIGHLGHLHHDLTDAHYAAIGRLDVLMVPVDGGMTQSLTNMSRIAERLYSSVILPMHRHATPIGEFISLMGEGFATDFRSERSVRLSLSNLPRQPTIVILDGV
ncbi:MBL fold metallo-hydrolase [Mesorhizobium australicum]|uniref:L-ascorbate metabolism protein UlaG, beta-lactamase superfamily n=1 Tax=Mesorhizobium australicum TaxID=536018 RepID=A0A1X7PZN4_9HYPH|nr:MBL fold metallo-hydrolase [Mesorhizobium australicum]SMH57572.1 L-ascorbate metabolism protein UlaG, beta-lactamase superfamily [Mesorhizobium australicum]